MVYGGLAAAATLVAWLVLFGVGGLAVERRLDVPRHRKALEDLRVRFWCFGDAPNTAPEMSAAAGRARERLSSLRGSLRHLDIGSLSKGRRTQT
jgi:hypothetical protein